MYTYIGTCDKTTDFPVDQSMTFPALGLGSKSSPKWLVCIFQSVFKFTTFGLDTCTQKNICVSTYAKRKMGCVLVAQPKTCHHGTGECVCVHHQLQTLPFLLQETSVSVTHYTYMAVSVSLITQLQHFSIQLSSHSILALSHAWPLVPSQAALWAYSSTGGGTPPGHTQFLRPRNL